MSSTPPGSESWLGHDVPALVNWLPLGRLPGNWHPRPAGQRSVPKRMLPNRPLQPARSSTDRARQADSSAEPVVPRRQQSSQPLSGPIGDDELTAGDGSGSLMVLF
jgi:hypothetical protein